MRITIVGAGPGGLVAAIAARHRGFDVEVLEQAPALRAVGSGVVLQVNALRMLATLGLDTSVAAAGAVLDEGTIERADGTAMQRIDLRRLRRRHGQPTVAIHRAALAEVLADRLPPGTVRFDARVTATEGGELECGGSVVDGDAVIGADGLHSEVRRLVAGRLAPRYAGYTCWRGVSDTSPLPPGRTCERWGRGQRFGIVPVGEGRTYWFGTEDCPPGGTDPLDVRASLEERFAAFAAPVAEILRTTPPSTILRNDIVDLPRLAAWWRGRHVLLGDAAHAMTPNLGQGACQAVEDAVVLAAALGSHADVPTAFTHYAMARMTRARRLQRLSDRVGNLGQGSNRWLASLRDVVFARLPGWVLERSLEAMVEVEIPEQP